MKTKTSFAIALIFIVLLIPSMHTKAFMAEEGTITKIATPFRPFAVKLLKTSNFPICLPTYFPPTNQENKWHLSLETSKNKFTIEIDQWTPDERTGTGLYAGTLSGNIENPLGPPIVEQFISENKEVKTINLANGIDGKEYIMDLNAFRAISWEIGRWSYFVAARPNNKEDRARNYASEIIKTIGENGLGLSGSPGNLYFLDIGANHPTMEIFWKVNDTVWYQLDWRDDPSVAVKILRSMTNLSVGQLSTTNETSSNNETDKLITQSTTNQSTQPEISTSEAWQIVSRLRYVQGEVVSLQQSPDGSITLSLRVEVSYHNGTDPIEDPDFPFKRGQIVEFIIKDRPPMDLSKFKRVIIYEGQVTTDGINDFLGAVVKYYEQDSNFFDLNGKQIKLPLEDYPQTIN
ncbi:hypothetical protein [Desulfosporosinus sp. SB140]|uniref:hypothetical protein n=1 Tax=Desulfosporosinus paludis TaxID=3115649 RepID=UPI00388D21C7